MQENKIYNRENYQRKKTYENKKKIFALGQINYRTQVELNEWKERIGNICKCDGKKITIEQEHENTCAAILEIQKYSAFYRKNYVDYKTTFNYFRNYSLYWKLENRKNKLEQFKLDKVFIKQLVLKRKMYDDLHE